MLFCLNDEMSAVACDFDVRISAIMTVTLVGFAALTWAAHARIGAILLKQ